MNTHVIPPIPVQCINYHLRSRGSWDDMSLEELTCCVAVNKITRKKGFLILILKVLKHREQGDVKQMIGQQIFSLELGYNRSQ